jgi:hypothetical protein
MVRFLPLRSRWRKAIANGRENHTNRREIVSETGTRRGRGGRIRTGDLLNPIQVRYRTALRPDEAMLARVPTAHKKRAEGALARCTSEKS